MKQRLLNVLVDIFSHHEVSFELFEQTRDVRIGIDDLDDNSVRALKKAIEEEGCIYATY